MTCVGKDCVSRPAHSHTHTADFPRGATQPKVAFPKHQIIFDQLTCVGKVCVSPPAHSHTADFPNKVSKELDQLLCVQIIFKWGLAKVCYLLARIREDFPNKVNKALVQLSCVQIFKWGLAKVSCVLDKSFVQKYRTKNFCLKIILFFCEKKASNNGTMLAKPQ